MKKCSLCIPVFNSEKYLNRCLCSFNDKNIEIICINDGSTDNSLKILLDFVRKDSRIKVINQENKGAAAARNLGDVYKRQ